MEFAAERDRRILDHVGICKVVAAQIQRTLPGQVELDNLIQAGVLGLMDAAEKYDPGKQVEFSSYAKHRIRGAILDSLRELDFASRDFRRRAKTMEAATGELANRLQRQPTQDEVAERLGISVEELRKLRLDAESIRHVSTRFISPNDGTVVEREFSSGQDTQPDNVYFQAETLAALYEAMKPLPPRQQQVVVDYYSGEKTMKEIGDSLGISESRVSQLHKTALVRMEASLRASGVCSAAAF